MTAVIAPDKKRAIEDLVEEIRITQSIIARSPAAVSHVVDLKTHLRGAFGTGRYRRMPHWELKDVLPDFELPTAWRMSGAFLAEHGETVFWLRGGITLVLNTRALGDVMTTTHEIELTHFTVSQLDELTTAVHHLQRLVISNH